MRVVIAAAASWLAVASGAHAQDLRVDAFQQICLDARQNYATSAQAAGALGWTPTNESVRPELQRIFAIARTADTPATPMSELQAFGRADQTSVFLVLSELTVSGQLVNGCYLYDFAATAPVPSGIFVERLGVPANEAITEPSIVISQKWVRPAALPNVATLRVGYIPERSELVEAAGFNGVALAVTSMSQ
jgi:hypothetical protein